MADYSTWKMLISERETHEEEYAAVINWCNEGNEYTIEKDELYYRVVPVEPVSEEIQKSIVREIRDRYLQDTDFTQLPDVPFTEIEKTQYVDYRQYLRDYTLEPNWWQQYPKTFEEWNRDIIGY